jgi:prophage antirepressor-like protein
MESVVNELTVLPFEGEDGIRMIMRGGQPWFVAADICRHLGIKDVSGAVEPLRATIKGKVLTPTLGGDQTLLIVSEPGLYTLVLRSRDAVKEGTAAYRFHVWVVDEVLPSIRRTGQYGSPVTQPRSVEDQRELIQDWIEWLGWDRDDKVILALATEYHHRKLREGLVLKQIEVDGKRHYDLVPVRQLLN